jgi:UDP-N-acetylmuramoyl-tripeptide--D-alanyl-D-alanine ligase
MRLSSTADRLGGELHGEDLEFRAVSIDTRTLQPGDLYLAIQGGRFDGNDFVEDARGKGACAAIVSRLADTDIPQLLIGDTTAALGQIAMMNRLASEAKLIAITGSQGKTTVKEMTGSILDKVGSTLVTRGNLNNEIGVPLTLLRLSDEHEFGVIEMGANHAGEIAYSVGLVKPDVALITNAARAHIEGFGSLQGVARSKGEIIDGLEPDGTMVLNGDDQFFEAWKARAADRKVVSFSTKNDRADYFADQVQRGQDGRLSFRLIANGINQTVTLSLLGRHNISNALAAAALAIESGAGVGHVREGLQCIEAVKGRLSPVDNVLGGTVIDDSYNASPDSFRAAIDVLAEFEGHRILLAGDMAELGATTDLAHTELGAYARDAGIEELWTIGEYVRLSTRTFGPGARHFNDKESVINHCLEAVKPGVTLLVKGSRSAGLDEVIAALATGRAKH